MSKLDISSRRIFQGDPVIWVVFFLFCMISVIEVFSAASTLTYKSGNFMEPLFKQLLFLCAGTAVVWFFHAIPCRYFKIVPIFFWPLSLILLFITPFIGVAENEGARWLPLPGGINFQPSEMAKGVVVISVALVLSKMQREDGADRRAFKMILFILLPVCALIFSENLSTAAILFATVFTMMFIGRVPLVQLGKLVGACAALAVAFVILVAMLPDKTVRENRFLHRVATWEQRIFNFAGSDEEGDAEKVAKDAFAAVAPSGKAAATSAEQAKDSVKLQIVHSHMREELENKPQESHANIAIASSGVVGKMPGKSDQRDHLAQAFSDFIYAIIIEEMGVLGAVGVMFLYIILLFRAGRISSRCERSFPAFLTMGLALLLVIQAMINMLVAVGLIPVTGQPLPLISRGGTSTLITCVYFGMILSVSRYARRNDEPAPDAAGEEHDADEEPFKSNEGIE